jgi:hypothetical protein
MRPILAACLAALLAFVAPWALADEVFRYSGLCDASAAVALDRDHFVVADDERNTLVTYQRGQPAPVALLPLGAFLGTAADKESDLEGAAAIGPRIYWISSHGRNKNGKPRKERYRFFATEVDSRTVPPSLRPVGVPYTGLLEDLLAADALKRYQLKDAAQRAPEAVGGFNIEGLAATADGNLLIGLRNPIVAGRALLVPLDNPEAVVNGQAARIGAPMLLDLGGRGIRSIERMGSVTFIVAGAPDDSGGFALYRWSGKADDAPVLVKGMDFGSLRPEALFELPMSNRLQILSDDGGVETGGAACKDHPVADRSFRSFTTNKPY